MNIKILNNGVFIRGAACLIFAVQSLSAQNSSPSPANSQQIVGTTNNQTPNKTDEELSPYKQLRYEFEFFVCLFCNNTEIKKVGVLS